MPKKFYTALGGGVAIFMLILAPNLTLSHNYPLSARVGFFSTLFHVFIA